jgi:hypothetical protein
MLYEKFMPEMKDIFRQLFNATKMGKLSGL